MPRNYEWPLPHKANDDDIPETPPEWFANARLVMPCTQRQEGDEYVCRCGVRWDVHEERPPCPSAVVFCSECNAPPADITEIDPELYGPSAGKRRWCCGRCDAVWCAP